MKRRAVLTMLGASAVALPWTAHAQQTERMRRIAMLSGGSGSDPALQQRTAAFLDELRRLGWSDESLQVDVRYCGNDFKLFRTSAAELVSLKPDVFFAVATASVIAAQEQTSTIPIIFVAVTDPVERGFVASLAHPAGNITGFSNYFETSTGGKWLELLREIAPGIARILLLGYANTDSATNVFEVYRRAILAAGSSLSLPVTLAPVRSDADVEAAIASFAGGPASGIIVIPDNFTSVHRAAIIRASLVHRVPALYPFTYFVGDGGLISYGINRDDQNRRAASYVDRILRGARPADLPVQNPTKFDLAINLKTAKAMGLTVPPLLLARADEVIE
jgi:putative ABC transport system substrate-binding protein